MEARLAQSAPPNQKPALRFIPPPLPRPRPSFFLRSLRGRLTLLIVAILAPALFFGAALIYQADRNERAAVGTKLLSTARAVATSPAVSS